MADRQGPVARLRTIQGHIRGVQRMENQGAYCIDLIKQVQAIQAALDKFNALVLEHHVATCLTATIRSGDPAERERVVNELLQVYRPPSDEAASAGQEPHSRLDALKQAEAGVQQIERLLQDQTDCIEIIQAAQLAKAALERFSAQILADHLRGCVTDAIRSDQVAEREQKLGELVQVFTAASTLRIA